MNPNHPVANIMTPNPVTVDSSTRLEEVRDIFSKNKFHHLPVLDNGNLVGIISKTDMLTYFRNLSSETLGKKYTLLSNYFINASDVMSTGLIKLESMDTIGLAADIFKANTLHCIPIVDGKVLVGILTTHDVIEYAFREVIRRVEK